MKNTMLLLEKALDRRRPNPTAANDATRYYSLAMALERENQRLRRTIDQIQTMADFGSANSPLFRA